MIPLAVNTTGLIISLSILGLLILAFIIYTLFFIKSVAKTIKEIYEIDQEIKKEIQAYFYNRGVKVIDIEKKKLLDSLFKDKITKENAYLLRELLRYDLKTANVKCDYALASFTSLTIAYIDSKFPNL